MNLYYPTDQCIKAYDRDDRPPIGLCLAGFALVSGLGWWLIGVLVVWVLA